MLYFLCAFQRACAAGPGLIAREAGVSSRRGGPERLCTVAQVVFDADAATVSELLKAVSDCGFEAELLHKSAAEAPSNEVTSPAPARWELAVVGAHGEAYASADEVSGTLHLLC